MITDGNALIVRDQDRTATFYGEAAIYCVAWSPDGEHLVAGDETGRLLFLRYFAG